MQEIKVIQVIKAVVSRGAGTEADPARWVVQYWSLEGKLLWEDDPVANEQLNRPAVWTGEEWR